MVLLISLEEGDTPTWVRLSSEGDSVLIDQAMNDYPFQIDQNELRPLCRTARGVKSMNLRKVIGLSMDVTADLVISSLVMKTKRKRK